MPLYEYECVKCGKHFERIEKFDGPHLKKCPSCKGRVERLISAPAIQFKGSGWYVTDYAKSSGGASEKQPTADAAPAAGPNAESKSGGKSDGKPTPGAKDKKKAPAKEN